MNEKHQYFVSCEDPNLDEIWSRIPETGDIVRLIDATSKFSSFFVSSAACISAIMHETSTYGLVCSIVYLENSRVKKCDFNSYEVFIQDSVEM